jgi:hypothetical protein
VTPAAQLLDNDDSDGSLSLEEGNPILKVEQQGPAPGLKGGKARSDSDVLLPPCQKKKCLSAIDVVGDGDESSDSDGNMFLKKKITPSTLQIAPAPAPVLPALAMKIKPGWKSTRR